ncbi:GTPase [Noviherbaspirillum sedimenti]|uniref:GTPase n=1 Tax=Noviherbaspirillum sedimenti TaxID=2320865 RepID=A0A3A3G5N4_9BURK|nr:GTPase [Noviherbaspirillum sedimenti]RJG02985.1 GTPase [Noviherbaspirillum sedimenti]
MHRIAATLVTGPSAALREAMIAGALDARLRTALILEGLPDGASPFGEALPTWLTIVRIAPGCICCSGNLPMRVTLNRILRQHPERLYISLANSSHLPQIREFLQQEPYDKWLSLTKELIANNHSHV